MEKYIINSKKKFSNYRDLDVAETDQVKGSTIAIVVDKECDSSISRYYNAINGCLKNGNRIIMIGVKDDNKSFNVLASLLVNYNNYDIYQEDTIDNIKEEYIEVLEKRGPDFSEVQTFLDSDIAAYSEVANIIFNMQSAVEDGDLDRLREVISSRSNSIEYLSNTINYMKKICDMYNSNELLINIGALKDEIAEALKKVESSKKDTEEARYERDKCKVNIEELKRENEKLKAKKSDGIVTEASSGAEASIKTYKEVNTQLMQCKTKLIIYFKEVSYVKYTNSLIVHLLNYLEKSKLKCKLVIYDTSTSMYTVYKPLQAVAGNEYLSMKGTLIGKTKAFVVSEPNSSIINDVLCSEQCFDVVIVYDRMRGVSDFISGNNVTRFLVINSSREYEAIKNIIKIQDLSTIITRADSNIEVQSGKARTFLDIPKIDNYNTMTDTSKMSKYIKMNTEFTNSPLLQTIINKARINTIMQK